MDRVGILLLAAGESRRMGRPKQLLPYRGKALIEVVAGRLLELEAEEVLVVLGAYSERIRPLLADLPLRTVNNPSWQEGMGSSLRMGVAALRGMDRVLVCLADQPRVPAAQYAALLALAEAHPEKVVAAAYAGRAGAPVVFPKAHFPRLEAAQGDAGARKWLSTLTEAELLTMPLPEAEWDWDVPEDMGGG